MTTTTALLNEALTRMMKRIDLCGIFVTDRDGVVIVSCTAAGGINEDQTMVNTFLLANEQCGKLKLGRNKSITSIYNNYVIVHMESLPFVITMVAKSANANIGSMLGLGNELKESLAPLKDVLGQN